MKDRAYTLRRLRERIDELPPLGLTHANSKRARIETLENDVAWLSGRVADLSRAVVLLLAEAEETA